MPARRSHQVIDIFYISVWIVSDGVRVSKRAHGDVPKSERRGSLVGACEPVPPHLFPQRGARDAEGLGRGGDGAASQGQRPLDVTLLGIFACRPERRNRIALGEGAAAALGEKISGHDPSTAGKRNR